MFFRIFQKVFQNDTDTWNPSPPKIKWDFEFFKSLQSKIPSIPVLGWLSMKNLTDDEGAGCSKYPELTDLHYRNKYWQIFKFFDKSPQANRTLEVTFHLYGAYFDNRSLLNQSMIRVISMVHSRFAFEYFKKNIQYVFQWPASVSSLLPHLVQWLQVSSCQSSDTFWAGNCWWESGHSSTLII